MSRVVFPITVEPAPEGGLRKQVFIENPDPLKTYALTMGCSTTSAVPGYRLDETVKLKLFPHQFRVYLPPKWKQLIGYDSLSGGGELPLTYTVLGPPSVPDHPEPEPKAPPVTEDVFLLRPEKPTNPHDPTRLLNRSHIFLWQITLETNGGTFQVTLLPMTLKSGGLAPGEHYKRIVNSYAERVT